MNGWVKGAMIVGATGLTATLAGRAITRRRRYFSLANKTVLVAGGSRGLGLVLARQLVDAGAKVAICARSDDDLQRAEEELRRRGGDVLRLACDIRDEHAVRSMVNQVWQKFGAIDALFNVAGIIEVGPLESMTAADFHTAMDVNCWGPLNTTLAVLPQMRRQGAGRIVNVASLGGKRAVPHMLPYCVSKFALVGLSNGLRTELAKDGVFVTTACPSLMRTGSPRNVWFKGQHQKEYSWFSIGDSLPMVSMDAERAAQQILRACQAGDGEVIISHPGNPGILFQSAFPGFTRELLMLANRILPEMGGIGRRAARGYQSESALSPSWATQLSDQAARRNKE